MSATTHSVQEASVLILKGAAPEHMIVEGHLKLSKQSELTSLPAHLSVTRLTLNGCSALKELPVGLHCYELSLADTPLRTLPADLSVEYRLDLSNCGLLEELPAGLKVGSLILRNCVSLCSLPEGLDVCFLNITGCTSLTTLPERGSIQSGWLVARGCTQLKELPSWLNRLSYLDISGCVNIDTLPGNLQLTSTLDVADTALKSLPASLSGVRLRWRDVAVTPRIAFQPETITAKEALNEPNAELRRVLIERMGYENFIEQASPTIVDCDADAGGERRLLNVRLLNDEPLVCLAVLCPSTARRYLIRVPPSMRTCHQAAAWIAGFDNPDEYKPVAET